jgi:hypothetical protein
MGLVTLNLKPSDKQLRSFGLVGLIMCVLIGGVLVGLKKIPIMAFIIFLIAGILLLVLSRISLKSIRYVYLALILVTFPIGWIFSHVVMALFYYGVITPIGIFFRLTKRDPLSRKYAPAADTYWIKYTRKRTAKSYFRQF